MNFDDIGVLVHLGFGLHWKEKEESLYYHCN